VRVRATLRADHAMPKSVIFTPPSGRTMMLPGFTSRWTMPDRCASASANAVCRNSESVVAVSSRPSRARRAESGSPSTSSMTRYASVSPVPSCAVASP
jgi:hypothetical protein